MSLVARSGPRNPTPSCQNVVLAARKTQLVLPRRSTDGKAIKLSTRPSLLRTAGRGPEGDHCEGGRQHRRHGLQGGATPGSKMHHNTVGISGRVITSVTKHPLAPCDKHYEKYNPIPD